MWLSQVWLFATSWTATHQASLSITNSRSLLKLMSIKSVMPSNPLTFCHPLLLLPSIFPSIRVFSNKSVLHIRWGKDWSCLTCTQISQEAGMVVWYSYLLKNFPQFVVIHSQRLWCSQWSRSRCFFWNSLAFSMIQQMLAIWSLAPVPFLNPLEYLEVLGSHTVEA